MNGTGAARFYSSFVVDDINVGKRHQAPVLECFREGQCHLQQFHQTLRVSR